MFEPGRRWREKPTRCHPKCGQRDGAACALLEVDRLSMVLETGASEVDASASRLRVSGAGEAQQPGQRGFRAARNAGSGFRPVGRRVRAERGVLAVSAVLCFMSVTRWSSSRVQRVVDALHGNAHAHTIPPEINSNDFGSFLELISRFEFEFCRREIFFF